MALVARPGGIVEIQFDTVCPVVASQVTCIEKVLKSVFFSCQTVGRRVTKLCSAIHVTWRNCKGSGVDALTKIRENVNCYNMDG